MKVPFVLPLRQTTGFVRSLLRLVGLDWVVPDYSTLCRLQKTLNVSLPYQGGTGPRKHGGSKHRIWRKIHIGIDKETLEVRAVEVAGSNVCDAPMLPELLDQIPLAQTIGLVTATSRQHPADSLVGLWMVHTTHANATRPFSSQQALEPPFSGGVEPLDRLENGHRTRD